MKLANLKVTEFLDELGSSSPAPGGGSVAALSGATGASLVTMVGALTTKKKKFKALEETEQKTYQEKIEFYQRAKISFQNYIDEDTAAFNEVMKAFKMPKITDEDKDLRFKSIELATVGCIKVPLEVANLALLCLNEMEYIINNSNRNTTSDQGVAILSFFTAFEGAIMNVKINLPGLSKKDLVNQYNSVIIDLSKQAKTKKDSLLDTINMYLK
ncbi:MAG: cyclodeaminase/cyclohydrolase family protein [Sphaerochaetaceae bacterium]|nr:cyclodeaminase/cyclohydrolase family protein [Sphaerochaetaceae bacterium]